MRAGRRAARGVVAFAAAVALGPALWPTAAAADMISATEGEAFSGQVAVYQTQPTCPSPTSPSATISWGDGGSSAAEVTASGSQLVVSGSYTYLEEGSYAGSVSGTYLCSGDHLSFSTTFSAQVADTPLTVYGGLKLSASITDHSFSGQVATLIAPYDGPGTNFVATIDWGDGSSSAGTVTPCTSGTFCVGTFFVSGSHQYGTAAGTDTVTVTVTDDGGASAKATDTLVVANKLLCPVNQSWPGSYSQYSLSSLYQLGSPAPVLDSSGNPTGQYSQTLTTGGIEAVTPECWYAVGDAEPGGSGHPVIHFLTFSGVSINGVYFTPESPDTLLVVGTDGSVVAGNLCGLRQIKLRGVRFPSARAHDSGCNASTYYDIEVPGNALPPYYIQASGPLVPVGRVDLRAHPMVDFDVDSTAFEPVNGGPMIGGNGISKASINTKPSYDPYPYMAEIDANIDLPGEFSMKASTGTPGAATSNSGGGQVTGSLTYFTAGPTPAGGGYSGGGGGASSGNNPCATLHPPQSCFPTAQARRHLAGAAGRRSAPAGGWDPAAPRHAAFIRAHQTSGSSCPPVGISTSQLYLGGLSLQNISLTCDPTAKYPWTGTASLDFHELPGGDSLPDANITFKLDGNGNFAGGRANLGPFSPGLPLFATPPVSLDSLGIGIGVHPTDFVGQAEVDILNGLVEIDGGVLVANADPADPYTYDSTSCDQGLQCPPLPGVNSLQWTGPITTFAAGVGGTVAIGDVPIFGTIQLASGHVFYVYPSYLEFAGHLGPITLGPVSAGADLQGAFDTSKGQYDASGDVYGCMDWPLYGNGCIQLAGEVSNAGVGACIGGKKTHGCSPVCVGFTYTWSGSFSLNVALRGSGCDFGPIVVQVYSVRRSAAAQAGGSVGFDLPRGLPGADVYVHGAGGPPQIELTGPHGERLSNPGVGQSARSDDLVLWPLPQLDETLIVMADPAAGHWTVTPLPGSPPITQLAYAKQLPSPQITTSVSRKGRSFTLHYRVRKETGQTVQFVERGGGVFHVLGRTSGGRAALRFTPALGPAGSREIVGVIAENGVPVSTLVVGRYKAPPIPRAARVRHLHIARIGRALVIRWDGGANTHGYLATAVLTDGRRLSYTLLGGTRRVSIKTFEPGTGAVVKVYGLGPTGVLGAAASARLAPPAPPRRVTTIRVRRTAAGLVVSWRPAARAARYLLELTISGPTSAVLFAFTDRPTLALRKDAALMLARGAHTEIQIRAVSIEGQQGPTGTLHYKAKGKRSHPRHTELFDLFD